MNTKLNIKIIGLLGVVVLTMACALGTPVQPQIDNVGTAVAATMQAFTAAAPTPDLSTQIVPTQIGGTTFSFKNISFFIPDGVASGANGEVVPAATEDQAGPWGMGPEHISIELSGYSTTNENTAVKNMILIYPAKEYAAAYQGAANSIQNLQAILASPSMSITTKTAPSVPVYNAGKTITAQTKILNFQNGSGLRLITEYAQYPAPITKNGEIYQYAGLTNDGNYFIIAVFPIQVPLQSTSDNPSADGVVYPIMGNADQATWDAYYQAMSDTLNAADSNTFQPSLNQLDALIQSITVGP